MVMVLEAGCFLYAPSEIVAAAAITAVVSPVAPALAALAVDQWVVLQTAAWLVPFSLEASSTVIYSLSLRYYAEPLLSVEATIAAPSS
jgi:hypothetical protein